MADKVRVESHGITCEVDAARFADQRFMYSLGKVLDERLSEQEKLTWYSRMFDATFGGAEAYAIMCDLADANGGACTTELFSAFFIDVMERAQAKNS